MTITTYQVNSVITAYTKQSRVKDTPAISKEDGSDGKHRDVVSLSETEESKAEELEKISSNLRNVILKDENI